MRAKWLATLFASFCLAATVHAKVFTEEEVGKALIEVAKRYSISIKDLFTLASIESNFEPLVITVETTPASARVLARLREAGLKIVSGGRTYHSKLAIVDIYPPDLETAQLIARELKRKGFTFDVGLMQINSVHFTERSVEHLFYPEENIEMAARIYRSCLQNFSTPVNQVECYNRGAGNLRRSLKKGKRYYPYWKRFCRHYRNYFR